MVKRPPPQLKQRGGGRLIIRFVRTDTSKEVMAMADKYDQALLKAQSGKPLDSNEAHAFKALCKEHGTERGNAARKLRDGK
jgi:hypothetical protein